MEKKNSNVPHRCASLTTCIQLMCDAYSFFFLNPSFSLGDYTISEFVYQGFRAQSVRIVFFFSFCPGTELNTNMDTIQIRGSCIEYYRISPTSVMGTQQKHIYIYFRMMYCCFDTNIYPPPPFFFCFM
jgi:hypothetical protein